MYRTIILYILFMFIALPVKSQWQNVMKDLIYSPKYFGPSAFPYPDSQEGVIRERSEAELRVDYHHYKGDCTWDFFVRGYVPFKKVAALEVSFIPKEHYRLTPETRDERHAVETKLPSNEKYCGDVIISSFFQLYRSKWIDFLAGANLKTASGGRVCDARFTDGVTYWFDLHAGSTVWTSVNKRATVRLHALTGFYCWMTNDLVHRQNDAILYGGGITGNWHDLNMMIDVIGFHGYKHNGDSPLSLRTNFTYAVRKLNLFTFRFRHGIHDNLYDSYSLAYIRRF